ncbi:hypothetical protein G7Z17_g3471 [Cylindrodendrum hubeiense]|uniref:Uncharacterized protein n=1 Tax=Cylindrodendrum hubeiense TaxID=595255 RepID=A0A9P5HAS2_9HYPO|nr:hypothetical protein G7Z17_g3471 [Cylindrodendrum hubeiense]
MAGLKEQVLDARYIIESKLIALLVELFPAGDYEWEVRSAVPTPKKNLANLEAITQADKQAYILRVPRPLTPVKQSSQ